MKLLTLIPKVLRVNYRTCLFLMRMIGCVVQHHVFIVNTLQNNKFLHLSKKLKAFAYKIQECDSNIEFIFSMIENIVEKGENGTKLVTIIFSISTLFSKGPSSSGWLKHRIVW